MFIAVLNPLAARLTAGVQRVFKLGFHLALMRTSLDDTIGLVLNGGH